MKKLTYACACVFLICASVAVLRWADRPVPSRYVLDEHGRSMLDSATGDIYMTAAGTVEEADGEYRRVSGIAEETMQDYAKQLVSQREADSGR